MNFRELFVGDNAMRITQNLSAGTHLLRSHLRIFSAMLLSASALFSLVLHPAYAAKPPPAPVSCSISQTPTIVAANEPVTLTATVTGKGKKTYVWDLDGGVSQNSETNLITVTYVDAGSYTADLEVSVKGEVGNCNHQVEVSEAVAPPPDLPNVSINSTSQNGTPGNPVIEQLLEGQSSYKLFSANDLGMHCGDFDTRISSILPPFQLVHTQVILRGSEPDILTPADGVEVVYSASSNPDDPILTGINSAGSGPVLSSMLLDGSVYKTNFWDVARDAYDPFYPKGILPFFYPPAPADILDLGLPMPNVEQLFLGDGNLTAEQQEMPGRSGPYVNNVPLLFELFTVDQPFFLNFPFGYNVEGVDWYEAAGIPLTAFDDFGRENPWALMRVQAKSGGQVLASLDTVLPISGEANCGACHNAEEDGGNGSAVAALTDVATADDDKDENGVAVNVPMEVSLEWAADTNILRLHDLKHGSGQAVPKYEPDLVDQTPVVCQTCHYTPALDLAQLGPLGPENDGPLVLNGVEVSPSLANGRDQLKHKSMSNVMHSHHGAVTDADGVKLFPDMPAAIKDENGVVTNAPARREALQETCYQCHPGRRTDCLRGAMANGGMLCQDCHGNMEQVGDDFTRNIALDNVGAFELGGDFYTNPDQPRVPWANEPGCGSCHTGDALDNLTGTNGAVVNNVDANMNADGIRLFQAFRTGDAKATPIVPDNKRFAENVIEGDNPAATDENDPRIGNPMLYRVSTGHGGVFCEACHGATHGIWPNKNPNANDNVTAMQLQGHTGAITECDTCHTGSFNIEDFKSSVAENGEMEGPHGMHPVNSPMWNEKHKEVFAQNKNSCRTCHGEDGKGTVLSATATTRTMECKNEEGNFPACAAGDKLVTVDAKTVIGCDNCHAMEN